MCSKWEYFIRTLGLGDELSQAVTESICVYFHVVSCESPKVIPYKYPETQLTVIMSLKIASSNFPSRPVYLKGPLI